MKGTIVNAVAILLGSGIGMVLRRGIPEKVQKTVMQGLALSVMLIGLKMAMQIQNILLVIGSLVIGGLLGEWWKLDERLNRLGQWLDATFAGEGSGLGRGFITCSLIYCVGAMAVVGSIQDGLTGDAGILYAKSMLDGISSIIFTSTLGLGVAISAASVFVYQGSIALLAKFFGNFASEAVINEMTATGGILIVGLAISMLEIKSVNVANLLPAVFVVIVLSRIAGV